jgi:hypothetical protein
VRVRVIKSPVVLKNGKRIVAIISDKIRFETLTTTEFNRTQPVDIILQRAASIKNLAELEKAREGRNGAHRRL